MAGAVTPNVVEWAPLPVRLGVGAKSHVNVPAAVAICHAVDPQLVLAEVVSFTVTVIAALGGT